MPAIVSRMPESLEGWMSGGQITCKEVQGNLQESETAQHFGMGKSPQTRRGTARGSLVFL